MPYKSAAQRRYLYAKHPRIAERWTARYGAKVGGGRLKTERQKRYRTPKR